MSPEEIFQQALNKRLSVNLDSEQAKRVVESVGHLVRSPVRVGRAGRDDRFYAEAANAYDVLRGAGSRKPVEDFRAVYDMLVGLL